MHRLQARRRRQGGRHAPQIAPYLPSKIRELGFSLTICQNTTGPLGRPVPCPSIWAAESRPTRARVEQVCRRPDASPCDASPDFTDPDNILQHRAKSASRKRADQATRSSQESRCAESETLDELMNRSNPIAKVVLNHAADKRLHDASPDLPVAERGVATP